MNDRISEGQEAIAALAYRYWTQRGCPIGSPEEDWFRAEQEIQGTGDPRRPDALPNALRELVR